MLISIIIISSLLLYLTFYFGILLHEKVKDTNNQFIFWFLYFTTFLSSLLVIFCFVVFIFFRKKQGPIGPRGFIGPQGQKGDKGTCPEVVKCKPKLIFKLIETVLEEKFKRELNDDEKTKIKLFVEERNYDITNQNKVTITKLKRFRTRLYTIDPNIPSDEITYKLHNLWTQTFQ
tara:strand:- start:331 stop:855 length:525 start_codon:yes stop_codon:yes gene_type:complete